MENRFYVYALRLENSKLPFYIGKGSGYRYKQHLSPKHRKKRDFKNSVINKAINEGINVIAEKLCVSMKESEAFVLESKLIKALGRRCNGGVLTNLTDGGEGPSGMSVCFSESHRLNLSVAGKSMEKSSCKICGLTASLSKITRYHNDKCGIKTVSKKIEGASNMNAKLEPCDVLDIRERAARGESKASIGRLYNIRDSHVCKIVQRKSWQHL